MLALVLDETLRLVSDYPQPEDDGLSRVRALEAGICNTDLELVKGYMGFSGVLGHEFVGRAETGTYAGRRVVGEINLSCWACDACHAGMDTQCPNRVTLGIDRKDGAFARYLTLPDVNLHPVPDAVSDDQAVFVEPLAAALQTLAMTPISPHDRVILLGAGKLGLLTAQVIARTGCDLAVVYRHEKQRQLLETWGIDATLAADLEPREADIVVDCTGHESGFADALNLVRPRGVIHLKSTYEGLPRADLTRVVVAEIRIETSRCGPFEAALRLLEHGEVDVESLIEARYPLDEGLEAFERASRKGALKVLLDIG